ncbi:MAG: alkaline phosphatase family protein [Candidatus Hodarchaeota archaeon]
MKNTDKKRIVIIGLDGVPYDLLKDLSNRDIMPNFRNLRTEGIFKKINSSLPEESSVSWSSIITGRNPGDHNIFGFTNIIKGTYTLSFTNFLKLKAQAFWQNDENKKYIIINVPMTYPAQKLNGFLVSGFVSPDLGKSVYPISYLNKLKSLNYQIDVNSSLVHKSISLFFKKLFKTLDNRIKLYRFLWNEIDWDYFMLVFTGSDRLEHFLWNAYENVEHEYHTDFLEFFRKIDSTIGEIINRLKKNDSLIMLSDHGMERTKINVNLNTYLVKEGLLKLGNEPKKRFNNIKEGTQVFALYPSRIYLNLKGRYPKGIVKSSEIDDLIDKISNLYKKLKFKGDKIIKRVFKKDEIYHGAYINNAPDLVLLSNEGYNLRANLHRDEIFEADIFPGKHSYDNAFLFIKDKNNIGLIPENPSVENIVTIIKNLYGE